MSAPNEWQLPSAPCTYMILLMQVNANILRYFLGTDADKTWSGDFYFVQGADPQFGQMSFYRNPNYVPAEADWNEELRLAKLAVRKVNKLEPKPRFFIICGDLTNEFPTGVVFI